MKVCVAPKNERKGTFEMSLLKCPKCGEYVLAHRVCKACGSYNGKEVVKKEA